MSNNNFSVAEKELYFKRVDAFAQLFKDVTLFDNADMLDEATKVMNASASLLIDTVLDGLRDLLLL